MNHQEFKSWLALSVHGALEPDQQKMLEEHLAECAECRSELGALRQVFATVDRSPRLAVTEELLREARQELRALLRVERSRISVWDQVMQSIDAWMAPWVKVSLASASMLVVGFIAGALAFRSPVSSNGMLIQQVSDNTQVLRGEPQITNVKFEDADPSDGTVSFSFDAMTPVQVKGSPNDPGVQSVLTKALMYEENPGVRLRAVSAITSQIQIQMTKPTKGDEEVKKALIETMKYDANTGVRREALRALDKFSFDNDIKQGLLFVLAKDGNESLRIEAINKLAAAKDEFKASSDKNLLEILRNRVQSDNNRYVRQRARAVLEEVQQ
jgi:HEAT repeats/Putative zinc-finger